MNCPALAMGRQVRVPPLRLQQALLFAPEGYEILGAS